MANHSISSRYLLGRLICDAITQPCEDKVFLYKLDYFIFIVGFIPVLMLFRTSLKLYVSRVSNKEGFFSTFISFIYRFLNFLCPETVSVFLIQLFLLLFGLVWHYFSYFLKIRLAHAEYFRTYRLLSLFIIYFIFSLIILFYYSRASEASFTQSNSILHKMFIFCFNVLGLKLVIFKEYDVFALPEMHIAIICIWGFLLGLLYRYFKNFFSDINRQSMNNCPSIASVLQCNSIQDSYTITKKISIL